MKQQQQATSENYRDRRKKDKKKSIGWEKRLRRATRREISRIHAWTTTTTKAGKV